MKVTFEFEKNEKSKANCALNVDKLLLFIVRMKRWIEKETSKHYDLAYEFKNGVKIVKDEGQEKAYLKLQELFEKYERGIECTDLEYEIYEIYHMED